MCCVLWERQHLPDWAYRHSRRMPGVFAQYGACSYNMHCFPDLNSTCRSFKQDRQTSEFLLSGQMLEPKHRQEFQMKQGSADNIKKWNTGDETVTQEWNVTKKLLHVHSIHNQRNSYMWQNLNTLHEHEYNTHCSHKKLPEHSFHNYWNDYFLLCYNNSEKYSVIINKGLNKIHLLT